MSAADLTRLIAPLEPLASVSGRAWAVGGGLRDALLGRPVADLDLAVEGDAAPFAAALARAHGADRFRLSRDFGSWSVTGGRLPIHVDITPLQGRDLAADLDRRDFTVNALALDISAPDAGVVDRHGGLADLSAGRLRLVSEGALAADPVRLMRLARQAQELGFTVDVAAVARAHADARALWRAPGERLMRELGRILALPRADLALRLLDSLGVLGVLVPQLEDCRGVDQSPYHHLDVLGHTLEVVQRTVEVCADPAPVFRGCAPRVADTLAAPLAEGLTARDGLVLAALLHDMAKAATRGVTPEGRITFIGHDRDGAEMADALLRRLRTSNRLREMVVSCIRWHLPLGFLVHRTPLSLRQIDRYLQLTSPQEVEVIVLTVADRLATHGPRTSEAAIRRHLVLAREVMSEHFRIADRSPIVPLMPGDALARAVARPPGPWLAQLQRQLREEQLVGAVRTRDEAARFAREWSESHPD